MDPILCLQLIRSRRVGPVTYHRLVAEHGVEGALDALPGIAAAAGVVGYEVCPLGVVRAELAAGARAGARLLLHGTPEYPASLMDLPDAPAVLWVQGDISLLMRPMVALVGARNASSLGLRMARKLAEGLGQGGQVVVSGLARGIDAEAHRAALATGTIAVQAGGVDHIYPAENATLAAQILERGLLVSEMPPGMEPQTRHFPLRNRIISGLSRAVVVVEAAARSGSLLTAEAALEQGREVLAVPGHPFDARAAGCNRLIKDGAALVRGVSDIFAALGEEMPRRSDAPVVAEEAPARRPRSKPAMHEPAPLPGPVPPRRPLLDISRLHTMILSRLGPSPLPEDQLIRDLAMPPSTLNPELIALELEGKIERRAGGMLSRL
ncbi:DNA-processing protein DprA [Rhodobacter sp. KR11]|uniref:DNA-processing protein DprA n=1 Tax=Rhodobacter sp. KR11 TaxID=2974588 RepID=UPI0022219004|nr:DNA-processing protein DprA [Rhodobacter sp. KR11]MCW1917140.1 DNA-processing protein DprA [Rhodobacter sp. KR11]